MKNALIVYESMFGGTRRVAEAIADGLSPSTRCTVTEVGDAPTVVLAPHTRTAAFDTRVKQRWVPGSAAHKIARAMTHKGLSPVQEPISFRIEGKTGPLLDGELARARHWGDVLGHRLRLGASS